MARKPDNFEWIGFTKEQRDLLDDIDFYGNNGWDRNGQSEILMPKIMKEAADLDLTVAQIREAMEQIGYSPRSTHQLQRWENKRLTGKFGR